MDRFNAILNDERYKHYLKQNNEIEVERVFCKHNLEHFLDVARIAQNINLEENLGFEKEIIYTTAILHDIGKSYQYNNKEEHEVASFRIAKEILRDYEFTEKEIEIIKEGILGHRKENNDKYASLLYKADKLSRLCFTCIAKNSCKWREDKKNLKIYY